MNVTLDIIIPLELYFLSNTIRMAVTFLIIGKSNLILSLFDFMFKYLFRPVLKHGPRSLISMLVVNKVNICANIIAILQFYM